MSIRSRILIQWRLAVDDPTEDAPLCHLQIWVIHSCPDCNQDLQVIVYGLFLSHCYSASSPAIVCSLKWAVSSIKPALPIPTLTGESTKQEKPTLHQVFKETGVTGPPSAPLTIYDPLYTQLLLKPSHRYKEVPGVERWKGSGWMPFLLAAFLSECHVEDLIVTLFLWCMWQYNIL